jgi:hypothetical protein
MAFQWSCQQKCDAKYDVFNQRAQITTCHYNIDFSKSTINLQKILAAYFKK